MSTANVLKDCMVFKQERRITASHAGISEFISHNSCLIKTEIKLHSLVHNVNGHTLIFACHQSGIQALCKDNA